MDSSDATSGLLRGMAQAGKKQRMLREFDQLDPRRVSQMTEKELAAWQANHPQDSAQWMLAMFEWQRRLVVEQIRAERFHVLVSVVCGLAGIVIGWLLSKW